MRRVSVAVPAARAEEARACMLELFPDGFEEVESADGVELIAYTDPRGEERLLCVFGSAAGSDVGHGWERRWREFHTPVRVGGLWIGPPWETPPQGELAVVIEPAQAFGTGAHPTTRLALALLLRMPRGSVLDVGCGSGVLAVAAAKVGFGPVRAVDVDPAAVDAARSNAAANDVSITVEQRDALTGELPRADVAVANVTHEMVAAVAARLPVTRLITSGYVAGRALALDGFRHLERLEEDGWAADAFKRLHE